jgi:hypothetical protein
LEGWIQLHAASHTPLPTLRRSTQG